ncbi:MarR family winged helix-turn-helix transcriptional regulator [Acidobacterium sp. S8]|uniref:MarR family winged helix-turn-helix transcriptional regulator n=1 Tax=Acidobacterium sp. S8 TaxID=1641854 RepID=UPI00131DF2C5|nr:MarR family transcriptional regulator [Acidobacterium sp. S8]
MPAEKQKLRENPIVTRRALGLLLSQLGTHAALSFGRKIAGFGISPPHLGMLRWIHANEGKNQRELASHLGMVPSRLVILLDELEAKGLVARARSLEDRRSQHLQLTRKGIQLLEKVERIATAHDEELGSSLTAAERETLIELCAKLAAHRGLTPDGHPGYGKRLAASRST